MAVCFFQIQFLKSYLGFAGLTFYVAGFGGQNYIVGKQKILCWQAVAAFFPTVFSHANSIRPLMQAGCGLFVTVFS